MPTSVFDPQNPAVDGQEKYAAFIAANGGQGIEIRRELFRTEDLPLEKCRRAIEQHQLNCVYSAPVELWLESGELNESGLEVILEEAQAIQADIVKMPLGHYDAVRSNVNAISGLLGRNLQGSKSMILTVENDQTAYGGNLQQLNAFFKAVSENAVPVRMTFDIGNWAYSGENAFAAAELLSRHVVYVHCKHVEQDGDQLKTVPITKEPNADWRQLLQRLPADAPAAIEFPVADASMLRDYIALLKKAMEKEEIT
ncbi:hypothetical protein VN24_01070 [Paenibacillus beijingensis]|uniref:Xylose isomerase-like TIM barrel domain-containing protein n=1 Tax=Paenibacillus beijingensis TaxID=1126833 RepID=A0A0D5NQF6_9BACL|nr:hypothetical protein VN24_01070 [Paenibacillus beijingensis]